MQAILLRAYGPAEALTAAALPDPEPGPDEILIRQRFAGVNYADIYMRNGLYRGPHTYGTELPFVPGLEGAGTVVAAGSGVTSFTPGDRVAYCLGRSGYAELVAVEAVKAARVPEDIELAVAAALMLQGATAHYLTHALYRVGPETTCLVHAGAGGVGQLLIQIAKARGARVITTVGSPEKEDIVRRLGADVVVRYRDVDFVGAVNRATGGEGVDVVYDSVGRDTIHGSLECLRVRGTCVLFGASSGAVDALAPMALAEAGSVFFTRPHLAHYRRTADDAQRQADDLFDLVRNRLLHRAIDSRFSLPDAAAAHRRLESRASQGKILLEL